MFACSLDGLPFQNEEFDFVYVGFLVQGIVLTPPLYIGTLNLAWHSLNLLQSKSSVGETLNYILHGTTTSSNISMRD